MTPEILGHQRDKKDKCLEMPNVLGCTTVAFPKLSNRMIQFGTQYLFHSNRNVIKFQSSAVKII